MCKWRVTVLYSMCVDYACACVACGCRLFFEGRESESEDEAALPRASARHVDYFGEGPRSCRNCVQPIHNTATNHTHHTPRIYVD